MTSSEYKEVRERLGSQPTVARMLGISRRTIARREAGFDVIREAELAIKALAKEAVEDKKE